MTTSIERINDYTGGGILPLAESFTTPGAVPPSWCEYFEQLKSGRFVNTNDGHAYCGKVFVAGG